MQHARNTSAGLKALTLCEMDSSTPIRAQAAEFMSIQRELVALRKRVRELGARSRQLETDIVEYVSQAHPGAKTARVGEMVFEISKTVKRPPKGKKQREQDLLQVLEQGGVRDASGLVQDIIEAQKGQEKESAKIKVLTK